METWGVCEPGSKAWAGPFPTASGGTSPAGRDIIMSVVKPPGCVTLLWRASWMNTLICMGHSHVHPRGGHGVCWPEFRGPLFGHPSPHHHGVSMASVRWVLKPFPNLTVFVSKLMLTAPHCTHPKGPLHHMCGFVSLWLC